LVCDEASMQRIEPEMAKSLSATISLTQRGTFPTPPLLPEEDKNRRIGLGSLRCSAKFRA
jgi:hypothetical protein